jgi:coproporphyrinogen III oxidase-like Fe-S oxidoreductase
MCSDFVRLPKNVWTKDSIKIKIDELSKDGLLELRDNQDCIKLTELGKNFRRNIASIFDPYFSRSQKVIHSRA